LLVQDPNGYFIPNIRRENFAVYENGVRQNADSVKIEHASVSLGLLLEYGGRYPSLNRDLTAAISGAGRELLKALGDRDQMAVWTYGDSLKQVADFDKGRTTLESFLFNLKPPDVSETNLYDALSGVQNAMNAVPGRQATVVVSSCVDTFSKTTYDDALAMAARSDTPIYVVSLANTMHMAAELHGSASPARIDWSAAERKLIGIAKASGGRLYSPKTEIDLEPAYDDMMENLKVRYVIRYHSPRSGDLNAPRTVRVELVNPATGKPLQIVDESGKPTHFDVILQETYTPSTASASLAH
jgi:VWFA-related protein